MVGKAGWEFTPVVGKGEKAERALALAVAEKAGRGLTPTVKKYGGGRDHAGGAEYVGCS